MVLNFYDVKIYYNLWKLQISAALIILRYILFWILKCFMKCENLKCFKSSEWGILFSMYSGGWKQNKNLKRKQVREIIDSCAEY